LTSAYAAARSQQAAMRPISACAILAATILLTAGPALAQGFKFSQPDTAGQAEEAARQDRIAEQLSTPCRAEIKGKKIAVIIGEVQSNGWISAQQQNYGPHFQAINTRLRALGLTTYTPEEIRRQIAQAEIDAYFRNDPDAALAAAKRLGASFVLRGLISSQAVLNPIVHVNQVSVNMGFTLSGSNGRILSDTQAESSSYAGADVSRMALTLVNEQADAVVAKLYADYCRNAVPARGTKAAPK
jgi:acid stress-induced BolA-like protein IbaG/YrbA